MVSLCNFAFNKGWLSLILSEIYKSVTFYFMKSISHQNLLHIQTRYKINFMYMVWQQGGSDVNKILGIY